MCTGYSLSHNAILYAQFLQRAAEGTYRLEIRAVSYSNPAHRDSAGICCEISGRRSNCDPWFCGHCECDNRFDFCLRRPGTPRDDNSGNCPLGSYTTGEVGDDSFNFGTSRIANGVANPMPFSGSVWPVSGDSKGVQPGSNWGPKISNTSICTGRAKV